MVHLGAGNRWGQGLVLWTKNQGSNSNVDMENHLGEAPNLFPRWWLEFRPGLAGARELQFLLQALDLLRNMVHVAALLIDTAAVGPRTCAPAAHKTKHEAAGCNDNIHSC